MDRASLLSSGLEQGIYSRLERGMLPPEIRFSKGVLFQQPHSMRETLKVGLRDHR